MVGHQVTTAVRTVFPFTEGSLGKSRNLVGAPGDFHGVGWPKGEGIDRSARPGPAGTAMAISHACRIARDFNPDGAAETRACMFGHSDFLLWVSKVSNREERPRKVPCFRGATNEFVRTGQAGSGTATGQAGQLT